MELCMDLLNDENGELKTDHEIIIDDLSKMNLAELPEDAGVLDDEDEEQENEKLLCIQKKRDSLTTYAENETQTREILC